MNMNLRVAVHRHNDVKYGQRSATRFALCVMNGPDHGIAVDARVVGLEHQLDPYKELLLFLRDPTARHEDARKEQRDGESSPQ